MVPIPQLRQARFHNSPGRVGSGPCEDRGAGLESAVSRLELLVKRGSGQVPGTRTYMAKTGEVEQKWLLVDANDKIVGRLATRLATILMGKHRPTYTPHVDTGDFVVVVNAEKVSLTGKKWEQKRYTWYTGYPGQKSETAEKRLAKKPEKILREAVRRMLPKSRLGIQMLGSPMDNQGSGPGAGDVAGEGQRAFGHATLYDALQFMSSRVNALPPRLGPEFNRFGTIADGGDVPNHA